MGRFGWDGVHADGVHLMGCTRLVDVAPRRGREDAAGRPGRVAEPDHLCVCVCVWMRERECVCV